MATTSQERLEEARRLLKAGERGAALDLIKTVLYEDRRNVGAWWLAAHAAPNRDETVIALRVVVKLQPDHAPARAALARLEAEPLPAPAPIKPPLRDAPAPLTSQTGSRGRRNLTTLVLILLSVIVMGGSGLLFLLNLTGNPIIRQIETGLSGGTLPTATPAFINTSSQVQGMLDAGETQVYRFYAEAETELFVGVGFAIVSPDADTSGALDLIDPEGYRAATNSPDSMPFTMPALPLLETGNIAVLQFTLDAQGIWEIRLHGREGTSAGAYVMLMECAPASNCGSPPPGTLSQPSS